MGGIAPSQSYGVVLLVSSCLKDSYKQTKPNLIWLFDWVDMNRAGPCSSLFSEKVFNFCSSLFILFIPVHPFLWILRLGISSVLDVSRRSVASGQSRGLRLKNASEKSGQSASPVVRFGLCGKLAISTGHIGVGRE